MQVPILTTAVGGVRTPTLLRNEFKTMPTLLVIDDEPAILRCFEATFLKSDVQVLTAETAEIGIRMVQEKHPDVVVSDIHLPDHSGLEAFRRIHVIDPKIPVILMTGGSTAQTVIEAMSGGVYEYLLKPLHIQQLQDVVGRAFEISRVMRVPAVMPKEKASPGPVEILIGRCPPMQDVYKSIGRVAPQDVTALILGESGTGKELVARAIYNYSRRRERPFLAINCAAIPETLLESELFGHEKGAFTGAERKRIGKFEQCSGGTLFLDEIGDMTPLTQTKILRVLQERQFERVGGNETISTDIRLITATNRNLEQAVATGQFRRDLYYRLNVYTIKIPPLRERKEDLPLLIEHFLARFSRELAKDVQRISPEALELLCAHSWPGNLRELQSALKQALLQATGAVLLPDFLPLGIRCPGQKPSELDSTNRPESDHFIQERLRAGSQDLYAEWLAVAEKRLLLQVLRHTVGNISQAARVLGIHRSTLRLKISSLGISLDHLDSNGSGGSLST